jgi:hypothetical protein
MRPWQSDSEWCLGLGFLPAHAQTDQSTLKGMIVISDKVLK